MRSFAIALASAFLLTPKFAVAGGFYNSCHNDWSMNNNVMQATWALRDGSTRFTTLDLNNCLTNINGNLIGRDGFVLVRHLPRKIYI
jgi:hypothetical protein